MIDAPTIEQPVYFERLAALETDHWWSVGMWRIVSRWLDTRLSGRRALRALDVGCGTGQTAYRLSQRPEIASVIGLDPSLDALRHAQGRRAASLVRGSALSLPFADREFDLVTCFDVFQHLESGDDQGAAREIRRVLKPGGLTVVRSNGRGFSRASAAYRLEDLAGVLAGSGLTILQTTHANLLGTLAQEVRGRWIGSRHPPHPSGGGLQIRRPHPTVNRIMTRVSGLEAWTIGRLGVSFPFGHTTLVFAEASG